MTIRAKQGPQYTFDAILQTPQQRETEGSHKILGAKAFLTRKFGIEIVRALIFGMKGKVESCSQAPGYYFTNLSI